jgi:hypothetical protein
MQVDRRQRHPLSLLSIFEAHVIKIHRTVQHLGDSVRRAGERAFLPQHLHDPLGRLARHRNHDKHHGNHHQAAEDLEAVGQKGGKLPHVEVEAPAGDDGIRAEGEHEHHDGIEAELHKRIVDSQDFFRPREIGADILRRG